MSSLALEERLLKKRKIDERGCWIYLGGKQKTGHGSITVAGKTMRVHRLAYELWVGKIPFEYQVLHKCGIAICFNPDHLYIGDHKQNMQDKIKHGTSLRKEKHPRVKLTQDMINDIRYEYVMENRTYKALGEIYNLSPGHIWKIINYKIWRED